MTIQRIKYANKERSFIKVFTEDSEWITAWPCETANLNEVKAALAAGVVIEDYETEADVAAEQAAKRKAEIYARFDQLDLASVRPLRAIINSTSTSEDIEKLQAIEQESTALRKELATL